MQRSDNFPLCETADLVCEGKRGKLFIFTGFPVKSAIVIPVNIPDGAELIVDTNFDQDDGFYVLYSNMPEGMNTVRFSYQAT